MDGSDVKARRQELLLSQEDLADDVGVSLRTIQAFERGQSRPMPEVLFRIAEVLGLPWEESERMEP